MAGVAGKFAPRTNQLQEPNAACPCDMKLNFLIISFATEGSDQVYCRRGTPPVFTTKLGHLPMWMAASFGKRTETLLLISRGSRPFRCRGYPASRRNEKNKNKWDKHPVSYLMKQEALNTSALTRSWSWHRRQTMSKPRRIVDPCYNGNGSVAQASFV